MQKFEINAAQLFLTYPKCPLLKEDVVHQLTRKFNVIHYLVASELHQDGTFHIHAYLKLDSHKPHRWKSPLFADLIGPDQKIYHGNYQGARSVNAVLGYVKKDGDYLSDLDVNALLAKGSIKRKQVGMEIINKKRTLLEVVKDNPELIFGYQRLKLDVDLIMQDLEETEGCLPPFLPNPWAMVLPSIKKTKRRHYWIWSSKPNAGKSFHFAKPLAQEYGAIIQTGDFTYWNVRRGTKCVILDEYNHAALRYHQLNAMADGNYGYRIFLGGLLVLKDPLIIILSNVSISTLYPIRNDLLHARFREIQLN